MKVDITWRPNPLATEQTALTIGAASVQLGAAINSQTYCLRISGTGNFHYMVGVNAVATAKSPLLSAGQVEYVAISPGDTFAIIQEAASTGNVTVTEMTH